MYNNLSHPDDLDAIADELDEMQLLQQLDSEEFPDIEEEDDMHLVLFKEDGDYGYITFAGVFDCLERIIGALSSEENDIVVAENAPDDTENPHIDFFLVDMAVEPVEQLFGVRLIPQNAQVNLY